MGIAFYLINIKAYDIDKDPSKDKLLDFEYKRK